MLQLDEQTLLELIQAPFFDINYIRAIFQSKQPLPERVSKELWSLFLSEVLTLPTPLDQTLLVDLDHFLTHSQTPTDAELLRIFTKEKHNQNSRNYLARAIDYRPSLTHYMAAAPEHLWYCQELAMSRHITLDIAKDLLQHTLTLPTKAPTTKAMLADLATNPWISYPLRLTAIDTYIQRYDPPSGGAELADSAVDGFGEYGPSWYGLRKFIQRAVTTNQPPLPVEIEFANLTPLELDSLHVQIRTAGDWEQYPALEAALDNFFAYPSPTPILTDSATAYLDSLGSTAWEIFISLLPGWHQSLAELLEVVTSNTTK